MQACSREQFRAPDARARAAGAGASGAACIHIFMHLIAQCPGFDYGESIETKNSSNRRLVGLFLQIGRELGG